MSQTQGSELALYYLNDLNQVQEMCWYPDQGWVHGGFSDMNVQATPDSQIAAIWVDDGIHVYFQTPSPGGIQEWVWSSATGAWSIGALLSGSTVTDLD